MTKKTASDKEGDPFWDWFISTATDAFRFLEADHGFGLDNVYTSKRSCCLEYKGDKVQLSILCEGISRPVIWVKFNSNTIYINQIIRKRCRDLEIPPEAEADDLKKDFAFVLNHYAKILQSYAVDILREEIDTSEWKKTKASS